MAEESKAESSATGTPEKCPEVLAADVALVRDAGHEVNVEKDEEGEGWTVVVTFAMEAARRGMRPELIVCATESYPAGVETEFTLLQRYLLATQRKVLVDAVAKLVADHDPAAETSLLGSIVDTAKKALTSVSYTCASPAHCSFGPDQSYKSFHTSHFLYNKLVGSGVHGKVYRCIASEKSAPTEPLVPLYGMKRFLFDFETASQDLIREVATLQRVTGHPYLLKVHGLAGDSNGLQLVMSYHMTTLHDVHFQRDLHKITRISYQLLTLAVFLEEQQILNRDWKPANVLWDETTHTIKLADFGQARMARPRMWGKHIFTLDYRPPEVCMGARNYTNKTDVWSIALILYFIAMRGPLFDTGDDDGDRQLLEMIFREIGSPWPRRGDDPWPEFKELPHYNMYWTMANVISGSTPRAKLRRSLLKKRPKEDLEAWGLFADMLEEMLVLNPDKRPSAAECFQCEIFRETRDEIAYVTREEVAEVSAAQSDGHIYSTTSDVKIPQISYMRHALDYVHPERQDITPFFPSPCACTAPDTDAAETKEKADETAPKGEQCAINAASAQNRAGLLRRVLVAFQKHFPLGADAYLQGMHLFDHFVQNVFQGRFSTFTFTDEHEPSDEEYVQRLASVAACFIVHKLEDDKYFDEECSNDTESTSEEDEQSSWPSSDTYVVEAQKDLYHEMVDAHVKAKKEREEEAAAKLTDEERAELEAAKKEEESDEEEEEEESSDSEEESEEPSEPFDEEDESLETESTDEASKLSLVMEEICGNDDSADLKQVEYLMMRQTGLRLYAQVTLSELLNTKLAAVSPEDKTLCLCLAVVSSADVHIPLLHSVTEISKALLELIRVANASDPVAELPASLTQWDGKEWACTCPCTTPLPALILKAAQNTPLTGALSEFNKRRLKAVQVCADAWRVGVTGDTETIQSHIDPTVLAVETECF